MLRRSLLHVNAIELYAFGSWRQQPGLLGSTILPCWRHLSPEVYRDLVAGLVKEIDAEAAAERKRAGREPLGVASILRQHPHTCPEKSKKSPAPRFHTASKAAREALRKAYGLFLSAFREAAERLKSGDRLAKFPLGCFPPGLPFVDA